MTPPGRPPGRRGPRPGAALLLLAGAAAACGPPPDAGDPSVRVEVVVSPVPATLTGTRVVVLVADSAGRGLTGATVEVAAATDDAGRDTTVTAGEEAEARYAVPDFPFGSPGEWLLEVRARTRDGREGRARQPILVLPGTGPGGGAR